MQTMAQLDPFGQRASFYHPNVRFLNAKPMVTGGRGWLAPRLPPPFGLPKPLITTPVGPKNNCFLLLKRTLLISMTWSCQNIFASQGLVEQYFPQKLIPIMKWFWALGHHICLTQINFAVPQNTFRMHFRICRCHQSCDTTNYLLLMQVI